VVRLKEFGDRIHAIYGNNLLRRHQPLPRAEENAVDGDLETWWATGSEAPATLTVQLPAAVTFDRCMTMERLDDGQHVRSYAIDARIDGAWRQIVHADVIGHKRIDVLDAPVTANAVRLRILAADGPVEIRDFGIYRDTAQGTK
jgi:alpha-L-fucosidase